MEQPLVTKEVTTVWRAGRRRFLTRREAYTYLARKRIERACECVEGQFGDEGRCEIAPESCRFHTWIDRNRRELGLFVENIPTYGEIVLERLARWYQFCDSRRPSHDLVRIKTDM